MNDEHAARRSDLLDQIAAKLPAEWADKRRIAAETMLNRGVVSFREVVTTSDAAFTTDLDTKSQRKVFWEPTSQEEPLSTVSVASKSRPFWGVAKSWVEAPWFPAVVSKPPAGRLQTEVHFELSPRLDVSRMKSVTVEHFKEQCNTGDLLLFSLDAAKGRLSREAIRMVDIIKTATGSPYQHAGFVCKEEQVYSVEATKSLGDKPRELQLKRPAESRIMEYPGYVVWRKMTKPLLKKPKQHALIIEALIEEASDGCYTLDLKDFPRGNLGLAKGAERRGQYFCSELVATALQRMGVISFARLPHTWAPGDFASKRGFPTRNDKTLYSWETEKVLENQHWRDALGVNTPTKTQASPAAPPRAQMRMPLHPLTCTKPAPPLTRLTKVGARHGAIPPLTQTFGGRQLCVAIGI